MPCYKIIMRRQADCTLCGKHFMRPTKDLKRTLCAACYEDLDGDAEPHCKYAEEKKGE